MGQWSCVTGVMCVNSAQTAKQRSGTWNCGRTTWFTFPVFCYCVWSWR